jgi:hypothetical protein
MNVFRHLSLLLLIAADLGAAQTCQTASELDPTLRDQLRAVALEYFRPVASGDAGALLQRATPEIARDPDAVRSLLQQHAMDLNGSTAQPRNVFAFEVGGGTPDPESVDVLCGVFNPALDLRTGFHLTGVRPGRYALVILDVAGRSSPYFFSFLLRQEGSQWRIAGIVPRARRLAGHDMAWFWRQAREYKARGQVMNAWFHYLAARELAAPVPFMTTTKLEAFYDEVAQAQPPDLPDQQPLILHDAEGKSVEVSTLYIVPNEAGDGLNLAFRYLATDVSDSRKILLENHAAMQAVVARFPEFRQAYGSIIAIAVAPDGQESGSILAMKDLKQP